VIICCKNKSFEPHLEYNTGQWKRPSKTQCAYGK
jgi:hypothetical protein